MEALKNFIVSTADFVCGYPLLFLLIGGGLYLFISSGAVSVRMLPESLRTLRQKQSKDGSGQISSAQALASVVAATIGLGNIAGVAIALVVGGPGAIFWMWVSAIVGMSTKFHEGALAVMYKGKDDQGNPRGGMMYVIEKGLGPKWKPAAIFFAIAGMFGTMCIMNANQLTEAYQSIFTTDEGLNANAFLSELSHLTSLSNIQVFRLLFGITIAMIVALVILGGIRRIANVASIMVPFMVGLYFLLVLYIILTHLGDVPTVFQRIFTEAFNLRAGFGAFIGVAIIGARRAALVNEAGIGTASIMHGSSRNNNPVKEGQVAMLGPAIDSGLVCTLTAISILLLVDLDNVNGMQGLSIAMEAFHNAVPYGEYILLVVVTCFALSSMFSYSYYGQSCATYLFGAKRGKYYVWVFIASLIIFALVPIEAAVGMCDLFYGLMAIPTMIAIIVLSRRVRAMVRKHKHKEGDQESQLDETCPIDPSPIKTES